MNQVKAYSILTMYVRHKRTPRPLQTYLDASRGSRLSLLMRTDGDIITLTSDGEFQEAARCARTANMALKISVCLTGRL